MASLSQKYIWPDDVKKIEIEILIQMEIKMYWVTNDLVFTDIYLGG